MGERICEEVRRCALGRDEQEAMLSSEHQGSRDEKGVGKQRRGKDGCSPCRPGLAMPRDLVSQLVGGASQPE